MSTITYLTRQDVAAAMPSWNEQIDLVEQTYVDLVGGLVELPPKPGIHPRQDAFIHAMPAHLRSTDAAGIKWVSGYPTNKALGLPYINGLLILNDANTGMPLSVMDCVEITAARTAAASGVCVRKWAPSGWNKVAIIGCGEQANYHAHMLQALNPDVEIAGYDIDVQRASAMHGITRVASSPQDACSDADIVITTGPFLATPQPAVFRSMLKDQVLVLPVDVDSFVDSSVINESDLFLTDYVTQYDYFVDHGTFAHWQRPHGNVGEFVRKDASAGLISVCNIGIGALDIAYAHRIFQLTQGKGLTLHL